MQIVYKDGLDGWRDRLENIFAVLGQNSQSYAGAPLVFGVITQPVVSFGSRRNNQGS